MQVVHILHLIFAAALVAMAVWGLQAPRRRRLSDADRAILQLTDRRSTVRRSRRATDL